MSTTGKYATPATTNTMLTQARGPLCPVASSCTSALSPCSSAAVTCPRTSLTMYVVNAT